MLSGNPSCSRRSVCPCTVSHSPATTLSRTYVKRAVHATPTPRVGYDFSSLKAYPLGGRTTRRVRQDYPAGGVASTEHLHFRPTVKNTSR
eukprot:5451602-Prymnesium_polylepis.1